MLISPAKMIEFSLLLASTVSSVPFLQCCR